MPRDVRYGIDLSDKNGQHSLQPLAKFYSCNSSEWPKWGRQWLFGCWCIQQATYVHIIIYQYYIIIYISYSQVSSTPHSAHWTTNKHMRDGNFSVNPDSRFIFLGEVGGTHHYTNLILFIARHWYECASTTCSSTTSRHILYITVVDETRHSN